MVSWVAALYNVVVGYQRFGEPCCFPLQGRTTTLQDAIIQKTSSKKYVTTNSYSIRGISNILKVAELTWIGAPKQRMISPLLSVHQYMTHTAKNENNSPTISMRAKRNCLRYFCRLVWCCVVKTGQKRVYDIALSPSGFDSQQMRRRDFVSLCHCVQTGSGAYQLSYLKI
jgi:hypothetical protein